MVAIFPASTTAGGNCFAMPDTCLTPAPPAPPVPIPYPNTGMVNQAKKTSKKVFAVPLVANGGRLAASSDPCCWLPSGCAVISPGRWLSPVRSAPATACGIEEAPAIPPGAAPFRMNCRRLTRPADRSDDSCAMTGLPSRSTARLDSNHFGGQGLTPARSAQEAYIASSSLTRSGY